MCSYVENEIVLFNSPIYYNRTDDGEDYLPPLGQGYIVTALKNRGIAARLIDCVYVTAGNIHDSIAWDTLYDDVTARFPEAEFIAMDSAYKTPWIAKKILDDNRLPILPYTRKTGRKDRFRPWDYTYDPAADSFICPKGKRLRHTTTTRERKRVYRCTPKECRACSSRELCGANAKGEKLIHTHIWQEYLDIVEQLRKTEIWKAVYARRKETIERVFADAKEKHGMRYTHHRGLARVTSWVRLKFAAINLKKLAI